jgi:hypothetical protein
MAYKPPDPPCPAKFKRVLYLPGECYVAHTTVRDKELGDVELLSTTKSLYGLKDGKTVWNCPFIELYSVDEDPEKEQQITFSFCIKVKIRVRINIKILQLLYLLIIYNLTGQEYFGFKHIEFENPTKKELWVIALQRLLRDFWQEYFEGRVQHSIVMFKKHLPISPFWFAESIIVDPEIYQVHRVLLRYNSKGKKAPSCFIMSTTTIYAYSVHKFSVEPDALLVSDLTWSNCSD